MSDAPTAPVAPTAAWRRRLWGLIRIAVSVAVLAWIFGAVPLDDVPRVALEAPGHTPDRVEGDLVHEDAASVTVRPAKGPEVTIPSGRVARRTPLPPRPGVRSVFRRASPSGLAVFFALSLVPMLLTTWRWWLLVLDQGVPISFLTCARLQLIGVFFNNFLLGATGGDVVKAAVAGTGTGRTARLLSTVFLDRVLGLLVVILISAGGLAAYLPFAPPGVADRFAAPGLVVGGLLLGGLGGYAVYYSRTIRGSAAARRVIDRLPLRGALREMDDVFHTYRDKKRLVAVTVGISLLSQAVLVTQFWLGGRALGITEAGFVDFVILFPLLEVAIALPISFGAWGVGEAAYQTLFGLVGVPAAQAVTLSLLSKVIPILYGIPGGLAFAAGQRRSAETGARPEAANRNETTSQQQNGTTEG